MKKILIGIIFILLSILLYFACFRGFKISKLNVKSVEQIKKMDEKLETTRSEAVQETSQNYPKTLSELEGAIKKLNIAKNKYDEKVEYNNSEYSVNSVQIDKYKIEFLWATLGNYAEKYNVKMQMDVKEGDSGRYNLEFYLVGSYIDVTDFLYKVENDSELGFKISDFLLLPDNTVTTTTLESETQPTVTERETAYSELLTIDSKEESNDNLINRQGTPEGTKHAYNPKRLEARFKVYGVEISFN